MSNSSLYWDTDVEQDDWSSLGNRVVACVILAVCFLVGTPGNLLVVWTILKHVKQRSHTVVLILHLAVADLLVLITLPLWIYSLAQSWVFGEPACKAVVYIIYSCMYSSVFIITVMSVERFIATRYPFKMLSWKNKTPMLRLLVVTWILSFILGIPVILTHSLDDDGDGTKHCLHRVYYSEFFEVFCMCLETLLGFVVPFFTLAICYCQVASQLQKVHFRRKQKSMVLIGGVILAFILCWLPHHVLNVIRLAILLGDQSEEAFYILENAVFIFGSLAFISSSVNPVLYVFASRNFHGSLKKSGIVKLFKDLGAQTQTKDDFLQDIRQQNEKILGSPIETELVGL